jgi:hypothetical protein
MSDDVFKELEDLRRVIDAPLPQSSNKNRRSPDTRQIHTIQPLHTPICSALVDFSDLLLGAEVPPELSPSVVLLT